MALTDFENALNGTSEIELTTTGRISGRETSRPVWFIRRDEKLYLLPVTGSRSQWYKNLLKTPAVRLSARGARYSAIGTPVTEASMFARVLEYFRAKYGAKNVGSLYPHPNVAVEIPLA